MSKTIEELRKELSKTLREAEKEPLGFNARAYVNRSLEQLGVKPLGEDEV